jgi:hypothetical protein
VTLLDYTRRTAQTGNMPRKSAAKKEEQPSSDEASAHSDVEMQDQQNDTISGFKKFGVSGTPFAPSSPRHSDVKAIEGATKWKSWANITDTV